MSSVAYLDVTFSKNVTLKEGTLDNLKERFDIIVDGATLTSSPISVQIINNIVRLKIANSDVPQPSQALEIKYTQGVVAPLSENEGALVDYSTGYPISSLVTVRTQDKTIDTPTNIRPTITSAVVEHEDPKTIVIKFTPGRDVSSNSFKGDDTYFPSQTGTAGYGITPKFELGNEGASSHPNWVDGSNNPVSDFETGKFSTLKLKTHSGEIQYGMKVTLDISGFNIVDQFDLSMNNENEMTTFTSSQFTNNVKQLRVDNAYISNIDPSSVIIYFKAGDVSGVDMDNPVNDLSTINQPGYPYSVFMNVDGTSSYYDVSGVEKIAYDEAGCEERGIPVEYKDVSGIRYQLHAFPFKYNNNNDPSGIKIRFDLNTTEGDNDRIRDVFGNECFNSGKDPKSVDDGGGDISGILVTNMIKGIKINSQFLDLSSGEVNDLSYNVILNFQTNGISPEDISGILATTNETDFSFNNITTGKIFHPDGVIQLSDPSRVKLYVNYNKDTFDKMITSGDEAKLSYINTSWPSSIKDQYGNFMLPQNNISLNNILDTSGNANVDGVELRKTGTDYDEIDISYNVDICLNYIDGSNNIYNNDGFTLSVSDPTGIEITEIVRVNDNKATIKLNKGLYATSLPTLTYSNTNSIIRNAWGPKLKNETLTTNLVDSLSVIEAPRQEFIFNTGKINELGIIDISFSEPIVGLGDKTGFKYAVGYSDSIADLSTNSFIDVPTSGVSLNDSSGIRLNTGYNESGGVRGFSKKTTGTGPYHITIKYTGPDVSSNRPVGDTGYLPDFGEISMADASNNIFDPSCNLSPPVDKPTAIVTHNDPNIVYVAMQQPAYNEEGFVELYDISQINFLPNNGAKFVYDSVVAGAGVGEYETTDISTKTGLALNGHTNDTKWIKATFAVDISSVDLSLNYPYSGGLRDQNGGMLPAFADMDICSNVLWCDVSGVGDGDGDGAQFETGYPFIYGDAGNTVICRWDPNFTDFQGTPLTSYSITDGTNSIVCSSQAAEQRPDGESVLKLSFSTDLYTNSGYRTLVYNKPVGNAGLKLGINSKWVRNFSNTVEDNDGLPTVTITAANGEGQTVTSNGAATSDPSLNLTFTGDISSSTFSINDISASTGIISNFLNSNGNLGWTAVFTPSAGHSGDCTIEILAGSYETDFEKGGRTNQSTVSFTWMRSSNQYEGDITVDEHNPNRVYFYYPDGDSVTTLPTVANFTFTDMVDNPNGTSTFVGNWTTDASTNWTNGTNNTDGFYYEGGNEWQWGATGKVAYSSTGATGDQTSFSATSITNNVETPFYSYPGPGGAKQSWINNDEPNSVYMGFRFDNGIMRNSLKEGNWAPDATYSVDRINKTKNFKFVTTNIDEPGKINIIDVSRVSIVSAVFVDTASYGSPSYDISMVKFDLSRNSNDISNVDNPYSFTSRDNIHMWWDYSEFADAYRFSDSSGNEIFDSSANVRGINTYYFNEQLGNDMSGNVADTTSPNLTGRWNFTPPNYFGALQINNIIQDISMVDVSANNSFSDEILEITFQGDVTFDSSIMTDISAVDWKIDISGGSGWNTLPDVSKNSIQIDGGATNKLVISFTPATGIFQPTDDIKITMNSMNNKPLSRQYIDISGNKLIPYNISNDGTGTLVTNGITEIFMEGGGF